MEAKAVLIQISGSNGCKFYKKNASLLLTWSMGKWLTENEKIPGHLATNLNSLPMCMAWLTSLVLVIGSLLLY